MKWGVAKGADVWVNASQRLTNQGRKAFKFKKKFKHLKVHRIRAIGKKFSGDNLGAIVRGEYWWVIG